MLQPCSMMALRHRFSNIKCPLFHPQWERMFLDSSGVFPNIPFFLQIMLCNPFCVIAYTYASWNFFKQRIHEEEISLLNFFGEEYLDYQKEVTTGLPFIQGYKMTLWWPWRNTSSRQRLNLVIHTDISYQNLCESLEYDNDTISVQDRYLNMALWKCLL